jgi:methionyl aminopeptidase
MRIPCRIVQKTLQEIKSRILPGISTQELDAFIEKQLKTAGARPALKGFNGYPAASCISVNEVCAHGVPGAYRLKNSDILTIDITVECDGWYGDSAWTYICGDHRTEDLMLLSAAWKSTMKGIKKAQAGKRLGDLGYEISSAAASMGYRIVKEMAGHGIGRHIHEDPAVFHYGKKNCGLPIVPGLVFTVEPVVSRNFSAYKKGEDGLSLVLENGERTAQFEHTLAVFSASTEILTMPPDTDTDSDFPPYY